MSSPTGKEKQLPDHLFFQKIRIILKDRELRRFDLRLSGDLYNVLQDSKTLPTQLLGLAAQSHNMRVISSKKQVGLQNKQQADSCISADENGTSDFKMASRSTSLLQKSPLVFSRLYWLNVYLCVCLALGGSC